MKINAIVNTDGKGYWTRASRSIKFTKLSVPYTNDDLNFGELRAHFDPKSWDVNEIGLVYTDKKALKGFQEYLTKIGLAGDDVQYSEQGMQGSNYVSYDVGEDFLKSWDKMEVVIA